MSQASNSPWDRLSFLLGTGLGFGYFPFMPGTIGSLWGLLLVWCIQWFTDKTEAQFIFACLFFLVGIAVCSRCIRRFATPDPKQIVFDEIAAFPFVYLFVAINLKTAVIGFIYFRIFDILKPWPIKKIEGLPGGLGVMADDLAAAIYAAAALMFTDRVLSEFI